MESWTKTYQQGSLSLQHVTLPSQPEEILLQQKGGGGGAGGGIGGGSGGGGGGGSVEAERKALEAKGASKRAVMWDLGTDPRISCTFFFFPKQFTVGVLNATLDLAALVLVGVVGFLGSEVVLSPVVSGCLPSCGGWVLVGVAAFLGSEVVLSPVVSGCLPSCRGGCWLVWPPSWALKWSCLPLSPVVSLHVGGGRWLVWPHLEQKHSEIKITGFNLNLLTVNCLGSTLV